MSKPVIEIIDDYFSRYLGYELGRVGRGQTVAVPSERRQRDEKGWGYTVAIQIHVSHERAVISSRPDLFESVEQLLVQEPKPVELLTVEWRHRIGQLVDPDQLGKLNVVLYGKSDSCPMVKNPKCRPLSESDVESYVRMKLDLYPAVNAENLATDIRRNIGDGIAFGVFDTDRLVSVSEAPAVGHMQDQIDEVGVDTLPEYRRKGYGKAVVSNMTKAILDLGRIPIYRYNPANEASLSLAKAVGYEKYGDIVEFRQRREKA